MVHHCAWLWPSAKVTLLRYHAGLLRAGAIGNGVLWYQVPMIGPSMVLKDETPTSSASSGRCTMRRMSHAQIQPISG